MNCIQIVFYSLGLIGASTDISLLWLPAAAQSWALPPGPSAAITVGQLLVMLLLMKFHSLATEMPGQEEGRWRKEGRNKTLNRVVGPLSVPKLPG